MDLHDYRDVAENYDAYLDVMYSEHDNYEGFQNFYLDLARTHGYAGTLENCTTSLIRIPDRALRLDGGGLLRRLPLQPRGHRAVRLGAAKEVRPCTMDQAPAWLMRGLCRASVSSNSSSCFRSGGTGCSCSRKWCRSWSTG